MSPRQRHQRTARQLMLAAVAEETLAALPDILVKLPALNAYESVMYDFNSLPQLDPDACPRYKDRTAVQVVNEDTFNAALDVAARQAGRVAVMNFASHRSPGGGWLVGATAQEEALCYRSSLALSLHKRYYPWRMNQGLYTKDVVIIRSAMDSDHRLLVPEVRPEDLPVVSVVSIAALCRPDKKTIQVTDGDVVKKKEVFSRPEDRDLTKAKMRLSLRIAAANGHSSLVLGALGCGAFGNPTETVAECWREVLEEPEFSGGWWQHICFAVYDRRREGNFEIFRDILGSLEI